jgi:HEPN domain-containing protein
MAALTRNTLIRLANVKRSDARLLLQNGRWSTAYYVYGLAVELAIKASIAKQIKAQIIPDRNFSRVFFSHELPALIALAGLTKSLESKLGDSEFKGAWEVVRSWNVESRYEHVDEVRAKAMADAVEGRKAGIYRWLKTHW